MKKSIYLLIVMFALIAYTGCRKEEGTDKTKLLISPDTLVFNGHESKAFYISTEPATECEFQVTSYPEWVQVSPTSGVIDKNNNLITIHVTSKYSLDNAGIYSGKLVILTSLGTDTVYLKGMVGEQLSYTIPDTLSFSVFADSKSLPILNSGNVPINYSASCSNNLISLSSATGSVAVGNQQEIQVNVNRQSLENGTYYSMIFISINNKIDTVQVKIEHFKEKKMMLDSDVTDAEYSKTKEILAYISAETGKLYVYHTSTNITNSIDLSYIPRCISVSQDGNTAVIGHDAHITYVNLNNMSIINTFDVSCNALDIVLGNNQWAYVFPKTDQWEHIYCVNLVSGAETTNTGYDIYAGTLARMHPSGKYIYGADNGLSPSDIEKYNIQNGTAEYMYDSPYHGDYPMSGNLWFSEDGYRIFTRGKTVLKTSSLQESDMIYNGSIVLEQPYNAIEWLDHSAATNNLYIISSADDYWEGSNKPFIYIYNSSNLVYRSKIELEKYLVPDNQGGGNFYDPEPYFVFSDSSGKKLFVLTKAVGSGLVNEWSLQKLVIR